MNREVLMKKAPPWVRGGVSVPLPSMPRLGMSTTPKRFSRACVEVASGNRQRVVALPGTPTYYSTVFFKASVQEADQFLAAAGLLQLADRLGFDLTDTLARDLEDVSDLFQGVAVAIA